MKQAQNRINLLVRRCIMPRANEIPCADCGHVWSEADPPELKHEYDHFKGYGVRNHEAVEPVCYACHVRRHDQRHKEDDREKVIVLEFIRGLLVE